ncbi:KAT8 regulatory NSL complex subunit 1-like isoform X2 [Gouania willdenowi]|uniref:KAT8 regulatory NSL complex subunit 1-like isoform X2 n=1 Tax=Gouania willdenowi TaxID=441366 RepID=UPI00105424E8|nr:KAT8 regulatory NSL complex subunit 1 isoform X2 [Gouania willdenowi]
MAAMAPALTDAPAEAHHIRFKLAAPSSSLSPPSAENNGNANSILLHSSAPPKCKPSTGDQDQPQQPLADPPGLGKLQPLVGSYLCSDVTATPSTKESLKIQGVLLTQSVLKNHRLLNGGGDFLLRKRQAIDIKGLMSGTNGGGQPMAPVNGLAKKLATMSSSGCVVAVNGDKPGTEPQAPPQDSQTLTLSGRVPLKHKHSPTDHAPCTTLEEAMPSSQQSAPCSSSSDVLDADIRERILLSTTRQAEIENRLRRLRKRLQVVQAKQVERHIQQQLGGFLDLALSRLLPPNRKADASGSWRPRGHSSSTGRDGLGRFLRSGAMPLELERLYLSGTANLRSAESAFDSDVTESSSGGDSDLEEEQLSKVDLEQRHVKLCKRAESRYSVDRAAIISHWNWLQAHISDLEYRIRQQTDVYRQIRASKGSLELGGLGDVKVEPVNAQDAVSERLEHTGHAHIASAEPGPWRGQNGQPVNGVLSRMSESPDKSYDSSCVAARTRPVVSCRRRRLIHPHTVPNLNGKAVRGGLSPCSSCRLNPSCVMCGGVAPPRDDPQYELPPLDRLSRLDLGLHPILSFPDDVCVSLRLQQVMKSQWQSRNLDRTKPLKKLSLKHKLSSTKEKHKFTNSLMAVRLGHYKRSDRSRMGEGCVGSSSLLSMSRMDSHTLCKATPPSSMGAYDRTYSRKRTRDSSLERTDSSLKVFLDTSSSCSALTNIHPTLHSPLTRQLSTSSEGSAPLGLSGQGLCNTPQPIKRRRGESSFDINNIVIPMSVAATTRVEKLQYKEILTPSWRTVDVCSQPITEEEDDREVEDLSDAAFLQLHQSYEDQERSRWSWMALAPKRRGSRSYKSMDGRTTPLLCGTNPPSPDSAHCPLLHDYGPVASPMNPPSPDTPSNPHTPCSRDSMRLMSSEDTRCSTPDYTYEERTVAPWERRCFPLGEDPTPEPEADAPRPRIRSISGFRASASGFGRMDLDDSEPPFDDDMAHRHRAPPTSSATAHR